MAAASDFSEAEQDRRRAQYARWVNLQVARARKDPGALMEFVMREEFSRRRIVCAPHQRVMFDFIMAHDKCVVRAPVGFTKTWVTIAITLWLLGDDVTQRGALLGAVEDIPMKVLGTVRSFIEESAELALVFPALRRTTRRGERWAQRQITVDRGGAIIRDPSLKAYGASGKLQGSRLSWMLADDLLTQENVDPETGGKRLKDWVYSTVLDRADAADAKIVVSNVPWSPKDITFELEHGEPGVPGWASLTLDAFGDVIIRNTDWDSPHIRPARGDNPKGERHRLSAHDSPAYAKYAGVQKPSPRWSDDEDQVPLWPEKYPHEVLERIRTSGRLPPHEFNRRYRCMVRDDADAVVKQSWIEASKKKARELGHAEIATSWTSGAYTGVDPAFGQTKHHDKTAIFTFAVLPTGHRRVLEVLVGRWHGAQVQDLIFSTQRKFNSIVCVEGNAAQVVIKQWANERNLTGVPVKSMATTFKKKSDPLYGLQSIFAEVEGGLWLIPSDAEGRCLGGIAELESSLLYYEPAKHTPDVLMAMWIAREFARKLGAFDSVASRGGGPRFAAALRR